MIDLFVSTCAENPIRAGLCRATIERWKRESGVRLKLLVFGNPAEAVRGYEDLIVHRGTLKNPGPFDASERERRYFAEQMAESDIYILADDDILLLQSDSAKQGEEILRKHKQFGKLCIRTIPDNPVSTIGGFSDSEVFETHGAGGIRFIRKGAVERWPPIGNEGYDAPHCREFHRRGWKVGYFKNLSGLHLGWGHTTSAQ